MKYFTALPLVASLASAQMSVMSLAPAAASGAAVHTVCITLHIVWFNSNNIQVVVGGLKPVETGMAAVLGYQPESITANVGDTVKFVFMQKNHTVTQSTFEAPCNKMDGGMDSGFMPNPMGEAGVEWEMQVPSMDPLCKLTFVTSASSVTNLDSRVLLQAEKRYSLRQRHGLFHQRQGGWREDFCPVQATRH
jgi:plastocyanin